MKKNKGGWIVLYIAMHWYGMRTGIGIHSVIRMDACYYGILV